MCSECLLFCHPRWVKERQERTMLNPGSPHRSGNPKNLGQTLKHRDFPPQVFLLTKANNKCITNLPCARHNCVQSFACLFPLSFVIEQCLLGNTSLTSVSEDESCLTPTPGLWSVSLSLKQNTCAPAYPCFLS